LFGDSITQYSFDPSLQGFGAALSNIFQRKLDVINRGYSGYNTAWCVALLPHVLTSTLPCPTTGTFATIKLITIFLGANDAVLPGNRQYVPLADYKKNLSKMIDLVLQNDPHTRYYFKSNYRILLITPPPVDPERWCNHKGAATPDRSITNTNMYRSACLEIGMDKRVVVLDTWKLFLGDYECTPETTRELLVDGLHLDIKGNKLVAAGIMDCIKSNWPEILPEQLVEPVVWHDKVDPKNVAASLFRRLN
jgi:lysophospholipase L1-like esterase